MLGMSNFAPARVVAPHRAATQGNLAACGRLQAEISHLSSLEAHGHWLSAIKFACSMLSLGIAYRHCRSSQRQRSTGRCSCLSSPGTASWGIYLSCTYSPNDEVRESIAAHGFTRVAN